MLHLDPASAAVDAVPADPARALIERQLQLLTRLADIGMDIAEVAGIRARASLDADAAEPTVDPGLTYARAARAVRLTIALQSRLLKDLAALDRTETEARKRRIHRIVERAIETEHDDADEIERLSDEARERLWDEDDCGDLLDRPIEEIVASICRDLGLDPDGIGWVDEYPQREGEGAGPLLPLREKLSAEPTDEGYASESGP
jgi:hypothetical protein